MHAAFGCPRHGNRAFRCGACGAAMFRGVGRLWLADRLTVEVEEGHDPEAFAGALSLLSGVEVDDRRVSWSWRKGRLSGFGPPAENSWGLAVFQAKTGTRRQNHRFSPPCPLGRNNSSRLSWARRDQRKRSRTTENVSTVTSQGGVRPWGVAPALVGYQSPGRTPPARAGVARVRARANTTRDRCPCQPGSARFKTPPTTNVIERRGPISTRNLQVGRSRRTSAGRPGWPLACRRSLQAREVVGPWRQPVGCRLCRLCPVLAPGRLLSRCRRRRHAAVRGARIRRAASHGPCSMGALRWSVADGRSSVLDRALNRPRLVRGQGTGNALISPRCPL